MSRGTCANPQHSSECCLPADSLYYVQCTRPAAVGDCALWHALNHHGYTTDLARAHVFTETEIRAKRWRPIDVPRPKSEVDEAATKHVHVEQLPEMPTWVRQESSWT